ncbi:ABC transporter ATP-binding protein [Bosea sp. BH3]|uniref:ABC transporter ATP-binding protein n=1 Tax=Bosea sp. BH3 TaxID=2871701 RepID=UPI0021CB1DBE|nr:ABC transporter ATP-binding protein [Bosea sp. BH3]MCU4180405.1 ABC transporter ATP-binding protein [Bosea sp. BH3]
MSSPTVNASELDPPRPILKLQRVRKTFQGQVVLDDLDLEIGAGEFLSLLGPSGCGKTTTLNLVAGFLKADAGYISLRGALSNELPPQKRKLGMVFQSYALFPHMTVFDNVAYGLHRRGVPSGQVSDRVAAMLDLVRLGQAQGKYPSQLSGGMQQRVALARALVTEPDLLLLDEPLSNLDAALRKDMQVEIKHIQERLKVATLLVTHSQEEALVMSDRMAVMRGGRIERIGPPHTVYSDPRTAFVCTFVGDANLFEARVAAHEGTPRLMVGDWAVLADGPLPEQAGTLGIAVRPEHIAIAPAGMASGDNVLSGSVSDTIFKGSNILYEVRVGDRDILVLGLPKIGEAPFARGDAVSIAFSRKAVILLAGAGHG